MQKPAIPQGGTSDVVRAFAYLATLIAALIAFFLTPLLFVLSIDWVLAFTAQSYAPGYDDLVRVAWFSATVIATFCVAWALFSTLLKMAALRIAYRLL